MIGFSATHVTSRLDQPCSHLLSWVRMTRPVWPRRMVLVGACMILALSVRSGVASSLRGSLGIHDPSTIVKCKDRYYVFGTGRGIVSKSSADKVFWESGQRVFSTAPAWNTNAVPAFDGTF